jgi:hypothetical protein
MARLTQNEVINGLVARGVPMHVATGVAMNFRDESAYNTGIQELNPHNGRGGYGLAQWTGPRRDALERYAASQGKSPDDPDMQLDYFMQENAGPEAKAWQSVVNSPDAQTAAVNFVNNWERPAAQHAAARSARYRGVGGAGVAVDDPTTDRTRPWSGPAEVTASQAPLTPPPAPASPAEAKGDALSDAVSGLGDFGGGARPAVTKLPTIAPPSATAVQSQPGMMVDPNQIAAQRQQLALVMQRLNSGKLWG